MNIQEGDILMYESSAVFRGREINPEVIVNIVKVKKLGENNTFYDNDDNLIEMYRCRYIFKNKEMIENPFYDIQRIIDDRIPISKKAYGEIGEI